MNVITLRRNNIPLLAVAAVLAFVFLASCDKEAGGGSDVPEELIGTWLDEYGDKLQFTPDGSVYIHLPCGYNISDNNEVLTLDYEVFTRTEGSGSTLVGAWDDGDGCILIFNADGTFTEDFDGDVESGAYEDETGIVTFIYPSGTASWNGNTITFEIEGNVWMVAEYTIEGNTLILIDDEDAVYTYTREN